MRHQIEENRQRKTRLKEVAESHMGYQEYCTLLNDIDKSIEQAFLSRFKASSKPKLFQKKKSSYTVDNISTLLQHRKKLLTEIGVYFPSSKFDVPTTSIYERHEKMDE